MDGRIPKPLKTAGELRAELEWATQVLTGDTSDSRILFELPTLAEGEDATSEYNWDVRVSCRPEQDDAARAAIRQVAGKWNLAARPMAHRQENANG